MKNKLIDNFFFNYRNKLEDFYPTEQYVLKRILSSYNSLDILDLGCASGGLYSAIQEIKTNINYTGVDIDQESIKTAKLIHNDAQFFNSDFLNFLKTKNRYDLITSFSCIDWDTGNKKYKFSPTVNKIFENLKVDGTLIISLRVSKEKSYFNSEKSYQVLTNGDQKVKAYYSIISQNELLKSLRKLHIKKLTASAFYNKPSDTSITPEKELLFCVLGITKAKGDNKGIIYDLDVPADFEIKIKTLG